MDSKPAGCHPSWLGPAQFVQAVVGRAFAASGRREEAAAVFEDLMGGGAAGIPRNIRWYATVAEASLLAAELGDEARARELLAIVEPVVEHHAVLPLASYGGPLTGCVARLEQTLGRLERACDRYEDAVEAAAAVGARPMQARALVELGGLLSRRGDRRAARARLAEGAELAEALGMAGLLRQVREVIPKL